MALDIHSPFLTGLYLFLLLTDGYRHFGFLHPLQPALQAGHSSEQVDFFCKLTLYISLLMRIKV